MELLSPSSSTVSPVPHFKLPVFEGPLALLLHLIRANEVDIYDIPIAEITQQYLAYMEFIEALDLAIAGEYLVIAATLIEIKSRMLLPAAPAAAGEEDSYDDPRAELVARLIEYQQYQGMIDTLRGWEELRRQIYFRGAQTTTDDYIMPIPDGEASVSQLLNALKRLLAASGLEDQPVTSVVPRRRLSLRLKMAEVARKTRAAGEFGLAFNNLFDLPCQRYEIVITFLALLELLRSGQIRACQDAPLMPIMLYPQESSAATNPGDFQNELAECSPLKVNDEQAAP